ncbi:actin-related protein T2-like [Struthio camelus]|uniref:actin-related protein T2-like n=1 Tax=Struthio camelus TaxID=8801 RepID=UPI00051E49A0|nr:PREDICTED: actin-related protein T2-like [Struthio camelus australis]
MFNSKALGISAVIFDSESQACKAGLSGESGPRHIIQCVIRHPKEEVSVSEESQKGWCVGEEAQHRPEVLSLNYPVENDVVTLWDDRERIWMLIYEHEMAKQATERPALMTESPLSPLENREKLIQLLRFRVPAFYVSAQAILYTLCASGRITGLVTDSRHSVTHPIAVYKGCCLPHAVSRLDIAGRDITELLTMLFLETEPSYAKFMEKNSFVEDVKDCAIWLQARSRSWPRSQKAYRPPSRSAVRIGTLLFQVSEVPFEPHRTSSEGPSLPRMFSHNVKKWDGSDCNASYRNMALSGHSSLFNRLDKWILKALEYQVPKGVPIKIIAPEDRQFSSWIGVS